MQSHCENAPFADVGGLEQRSNFRASRWFSEQYPDDEEGRMLAAYFDGYRAAARELYGADWQICEFGWKPALRIDAGGLIKDGS